MEFEKELGKKMQGDLHAGSKHLYKTLLKIHKFQYKSKLNHIQTWDVSDIISMPCAALKENILLD